jgi:hypothetical protein
VLTDDDVRTKDRVWRVTAFAIVVANVILGVVELKHYGSASDDCLFDNPECGRRINHALDISNTWESIAALPAVLSLLLPLRRSTTPWRIACVAVLALTFVVRLILLISH